MNDCLKCYLVSLSIAYDCYHIIYSYILQYCFINIRVPFEEKNCTLEFQINYVFVML